MAQIYAIEIGCEVETLRVEKNDSCICNLVTEHDKDTEQNISISREVWPLLKQAIDFAFDEQNQS